MKKEDIVKAYLDIRKTNNTIPDDTLNFMKDCAVAHLAPTKRFTTEGFVYGNYWGGGKGAYKATELEGTSIEEITQLANDGLNGSLDSGMGYESLIGAYLIVTEHTTIEVNGIASVNKQHHDLFVGDLSDEEKQFLSECIYF
jgi:hypothetical protein